GPPGGGGRSRRGRGRIASPATPSTSKSNGQPTGDPRPDRQPARNANSSKSTTPKYAGPGSRSAPAYAITPKPTARIHSSQPKPTEPTTPCPSGFDAGLATKNAVARHVKISV